MKGGTVGKEKTASDGSYLSVGVRAVDAGECRYSGDSGGVGVAAAGHCRLVRMWRARRLSSSQKAIVP